MRAIVGNCAAVRRAIWAASILIALFAVLIASGAVAATFRVAMATDAATLDPHALNAGSTTLVLRQIYEPLVGQGRNLEAVPGLAVRWSRIEPTVWRFHLRANVRFQDGATFDADDVAFSIARAKAGVSDFRIYTSDIVDVREVGPLTVDIRTAGPDPLLPDKLSRVFIMDRDWAMRHNVEQPQDFSRRQASYAATHVNGTGPYRLVRREPDGKTELQRNPAWWGKNDSGIEDVLFQPIASDGSRIAALLAGDVDLVIDVPPQLEGRIRQDSGLKIVERTENRTIFLGMDVKRDELLYGDVKGRNPFKDRRVREAINLAVDAEAIKTRLMHGHSVPTALLWAPSVFGYAADEDRRPKVDVKKAKELVAEAGYPAGFGVKLDCPTDRYVNDRQICEALASQLARVGIRITVNALPFSLYISRLKKSDTSFYLVGWATPMFDAFATLNAFVHTPGAGSGGVFNFGGYSNPAIDSLIDRMRFEPDAKKRYGQIREATRLLQEDVGYIPIHHQTIMWAMRANIDAAPPPENQLDVRWIGIRR